MYDQNKTEKHQTLKQADASQKKRVEMTQAKHNIFSKISKASLSFAGRFIGRAMVILLLFAMAMAATQAFFTSPQEAYEEALVKLTEYKLEKLHNKKLKDSTLEDFSEMKRLEEKLDSIATPQIKNLPPNSSSDEEKKI